jgi:hypothetical protein
MTTAINHPNALGACVPDRQDTGGRDLQRTLRASVSQVLDVRRQGHGLHGMVLAIRDALASGEKADELAAKVDKALDAASKHLVEQGYSQDEIDTAVARFRDRLAHEIDALTNAAPSAGGDAATTGAAQRVAVAEAARAVKRERFSLDILTAEGDEVSIRFKSLQVANVAAARVSEGDASATAVQGSVISRGRFTIEVDGDLNDAERAAIDDLLDEVDGTATDFFGGDVQAAFAAASRVGLEGDALSAFSVRMSYAKSVTAAQAYATTAALVDTPKAHAPAAPTIPKVTVPAMPVATTDPVGVADAPAADSMTPGGAASETAAGATTSASRTIASFTKDVLARLSTAGENAGARFSLRWKVEFLVSALSAAAAAQDPEAQPAVNALGDSLAA